MHNPSISRPNVPKSIIFGIIILCILPFLLNQLGLDFSTPGTPLEVTEILDWDSEKLTDALHLTLAGSFVHTLLEWTACCAAIVIVFLSLLNYTATGKPISPILGLALFFAGLMDAFHTLMANRLLDLAIDNPNLIPFTWVICRLFHALIMVFGVSILIVYSPDTDRKNQRKTLIFISIFSCIFGIIAYGIINFYASNHNLPETIFPNQIISRPWDVIPMLIFAFAGLVIYPKFYQQNPNVFTHSIVISVIPNIATQLYMAFGSSALFDNGFNIAHFLKIFAYLVPLIGLSSDYINSYRNQNRSLSIDLQRSWEFLNSLADQVLDSTRLTRPLQESGEQLESMVIQQVTATQEAVQTTQEISAVSEQLFSIVGEIEQAFTRIKNSGDSLSSKLGNIAQETTHLPQIINQINYIATQTKMLSLNASIEATKVGKEGTGFTVIANEIIKLAEQTSAITQEINPMIQGMQAAVNSGVKEMNKLNHLTIEEVNKLTAITQTIDRTIKMQRDGAYKIQESLKELSYASENASNYLRKTLDKTNDSLENLHQSVEQLQAEMLRLADRDKAF
ncbi:MULTISPECIES: methyl-accepting chemotaxis protein [Planktothricoides]|uniref:Methyl-accepting chemotaxis protein n=1 Tax=Planktothricoides raciborskii GIHE-MW2 TaxID=2792601 RepID=A0AAU8JBF4_9CYAN|nr:methyl-accepting chemotaxis protein [Planktothricoides sp. SR001]